MTVGPRQPDQTHSDLLGRIKVLEPDAERHVVNQHVVSRVVLKGFAATGKNSLGWQLTPFNVRLRHERRSRGLSGCGKMPNFLTYASESAEQVWKEVEDRLDTAIKAARQGSPSLRSHAGTLKDAVALHLARSPRYMQLHQDIVAKTIEDVRRDVLSSRMSMLQAEFRRRYGPEPAGREALEAVLEEPLGEWRKLAERGAIARVSMEATFRKIRTMLEQPWAVEVWQVPDYLELLISDSPAITIRYDKRLNIQMHVAVGDANCIVMPIARDCLVALGPTPKRAVLLPNQVDLFNRLQVASAYEHVYYRPGSALKMFVAAELSARH